MGAVNEKYLYTSCVSLQPISNQKRYNKLMGRYIYWKVKNVENRFQVILKNFEITAKTKRKFIIIFCETLKREKIFTEKISN